MKNPTVNIGGLKKKGHEISQGGGGGDHHVNFPFSQQKSSSHHPHPFLLSRR